MTSALGYLWRALLKRRLLNFCHSLRRPATLIGVAAVVTFIAFLFHFRHEEIFGQVVRRESLIGLGLVMVCGSLFKGFLQRGLSFEPPDLQFLFTTQRQIVLYRLWPNYLYSALQALVFLVIFYSHLSHPWVAACSLFSFQIACFHIATGTAMFAGSLEEELHYRIRWMLLASFFLLTAWYLRQVWDLRLLPSFAASPLVQLAFYPAASISDAAMSTSFLSLFDGPSSYPWTHLAWHQVAWLAAFVLAASGSLWLLLQLKLNVFEAAMETTIRIAEKRVRLQRGQTATVEETAFRSARLPAIPMFRGIGALVWKNLLVARRCKRRLFLAAAFTFIYTGFLIALVWVYHRYIAEGGSLSARDTQDFHSGIAMCLAMLAFLLQPVLPFDFRRDGHHLLGFRTLPFSPLLVTLAEIAVPTLLCLAFQTAGIAALICFNGSGSYVLLLVLFAFPAIAVALNSVWNIHYLLSAAKQTSSDVPSASAVGTLVVVALSFLVFYPAGWTAMKVGQHLPTATGVPAAMVVWSVVQYGIDVLLILIMARLFNRFEVSRDSS